LRAIAVRGSRFAVRGSRFAVRDDRSPYGRRHSYAYETGPSYRVPGDRRRGRLVGGYQADQGLSGL
jgi:hypothetical protein